MWAASVSSSEVRWADPQWQDFNLTTGSVPEAGQVSQDYFCFSTFAGPGAPNAHVPCPGDSSLLRESNVSPSGAKRVLLWRREALCVSPTSSFRTFLPLAVILSPALCLS